MNQTLIHFATQHPGMSQNTVASPTALTRAADIEESTVKAVTLPTDICVVEWHGPAHRDAFLQAWERAGGLRLFPSSPAR